MYEQITRSITADRRTGFFLIQPALTSTMTGRIPRQPPPSSSLRLREVFVKPLAGQRAAHRRARRRLLAAVIALPEKSALILAQ
jgi:hypothetical protein